MEGKLYSLRQENKKLKSKIKILEKFLDDSLGYFDSISDDEQKRFGKRMERYQKSLDRLKQ